LSNDRAIIGCSNKTAIEKLREILCIELVVENAMELAKGGGDKEQRKFGKRGKY